MKRTITDYFNQKWASNQTAIEFLFNSVKPNNNNVFNTLTGVSGTGKTSLLVDKFLLNIITKHQSSISHIKFLVLKKQLQSIIIKYIINELNKIQKFGVLTNSEISYFFTKADSMIQTIGSFCYQIFSIAKKMKFIANSKVFTKLEYFTVADFDENLNELIRYELSDSEKLWPANLKSLSNTPFLREQLRDFIIFAKQKGLTTSQLQKIGRTESNQNWCAIADIWEEYENVMRLRFPTENSKINILPILDGSSLIVVALQLVSNFKELLIKIQSNTQYLYVDDMQLLSESALELITFIKSNSKNGTCNLAGDMFQKEHIDSSIKLSRLIKESTNWKLKQNYRFGTAINTVCENLLLEFPNQKKILKTFPQLSISDKVKFLHFKSIEDQSKYLINYLYDLKINGNNNWSDIAIITRSPKLIIPQLKPIFKSAEIPLELMTIPVPLRENQYVYELLLWLEFILSIKNSTKISDSIYWNKTILVRLFQGFYCANDKSIFKKLRIKLYQFGFADLEIFNLGNFLTKYLVESEFKNKINEKFATSSLLELLNKFEFILTNFIDAYNNQTNIHELLWLVWSLSGAEKLIINNIKNKKSTQVQETLNYVNTLFNYTHEYCLNQSGLDIKDFLIKIKNQNITILKRAYIGMEADSVKLITPQYALGKEWKHIIIYGAQNDLWSNQNFETDLFEKNKLTDILSGIQSSVVNILDQRQRKRLLELQLFYISCTRASSSLMITAVNTNTSTNNFMPVTPVSYLQNLNNRLKKIPNLTKSIELFTDFPMVFKLNNPEFSMILPEFVASLRAQLLIGDETSLEPAAELIAILAKMNISGANPIDWYGCTKPTEITSDFSLKVLTPTFIERAQKCPLQALLYYLISSSVNSVEVIIGNIVHLLAERVKIADLMHYFPDIKCLLLELKDNLNIEYWKIKGMLRELSNLLTNYDKWHANTKSTVIEAENEYKIKQKLSFGNDLVLQGRIDRLQHLPDGTVRIIDFKTSKSNPISEREISKNIQLSLYQYALHNNSKSVESAQLVYLSHEQQKTKVAIRIQRSLNEDELKEVENQIKNTYKKLTNEKIFVTHNELCRTCVFINVCPIDKLLFN